MKDIKKFFFFAGGVILPRISSISIELLEKKNGSPLLSNQRGILYESEKGLITAKNSPDSYLNLLCSLKSAITPCADLANDLMKLMRVDAATLSVAADLSRTSQVYLFSDYPEEWIKGIQKILETNFLFPFKEIIYSSGLNLIDDSNSIFEKLETNGLLEPGKSLWVDAYPMRTSAAIRRGIDSIIYVDERRLRRELNLRKLMGPSQV